MYDTCDTHKYWIDATHPTCAQWYNLGLPKYFALLEIWEILHQQEIINYLITFEYFLFFLLFVCIFVNVCVFLSVFVRLNKDPETGSKILISKPQGTMTIFSCSHSVVIFINSYRSLSEWVNQFTLIQKIQKPIPAHTPFLWALFEKKQTS